MCLAREALFAKADLRGQNTQALGKCNIPTYLKLRSSRLTSHIPEGERFPSGVLNSEHRHPPPAMFWPWGRSANRISKAEGTRWESLSLRAVVTYQLIAHVPQHDSTTHDEISAWKSQNSNSEPRLLPVVCSSSSLRRRVFLQQELVHPKKDVCETHGRHLDIRTWPISPNTTAVANKSPIYGTACRPHTRYLVK